MTDIETPEHGTDPRMEAVSDALIGTQSSWVTIKDGTVIVDMDEVSRIAVFAVESIDSDDHCKWMCHLDEQERIVEILNETWKATNRDNSSGLPFVAFHVSLSISTIRSCSSR